MAFSNEVLELVLLEGEGYRIEFTNPGGLVKGLTPETFGTVSMLRNPGIANLFQRIDYIEKMGTGITRIRMALKKANLPDVRFDFMPYFVRAIFTRPAGKSSEKILRMMEAEPEISATEMADKAGISRRAVEKIIDKLKKKNLIQRVGPDKSGHWEIIRKGHDEKPNGK